MATNLAISDESSRGGGFCDESGHFAGFYRPVGDDLSHKEVPMGETKLGGTERVADLKKTGSELGRGGAE